MNSMILFYFIQYREKESYGVLKDLTKLKRLAEKRLSSEQLEIIEEKISNKFGEKILLRDNCRIGVFAKDHIGLVYFKKNRLDLPINALDFDEDFIKEYEEYKQKYNNLKKEYRDIEKKMDELKIGDFTQSYL